MQYFLSVVMSLLGVSECHCGFWCAGCLALDVSVPWDVHSCLSFTSLGESKAFLGTIKSCWSKRARRPWPEHLRPALRPWVCACLSCRMWWCHVFRFNPEPWAPRGRFAQPAHSHHFRSHSTDLTTRGLPRYVCPPILPSPGPSSSTHTAFLLVAVSGVCGHSCLCHKSNCFTSK